jgi:hypothetical protein
MAARDRSTYLVLIVFIVLLTNGKRCQVDIEFGGEKYSRLLGHSLFKKSRPCGYILQKDFGVEVCLCTLFQN